MGLFKIFISKRKFSLSFSVDGWWFPRQVIMQSISIPVYFFASLIWVNVCCLSSLFVDFIVWFSQWNIEDLSFHAIVSTAPPPLDNLRHWLISAHSPFGEFFLETTWNWRVVSSFEDCYIFVNVLNSKKCFISIT